MKMPVALMLTAAAMAPLTFDLPQSRRDSSVTSLTIGAGSGTYADITRGCNGEVYEKGSRKFRDKGFAVEHEFVGPAVVGVRGARVGGLVEYDGEDPPDWNWNPYAALEWEKGGFGIGYVFGHGEWGDLEVPSTSGHVRLGNPRDGVALALRWFEDVPAFTSGGVVTLGVGFSPSQRSEMWLGLGGGAPYDNVGFFMRTRTPPWRGFTASTGIHLGRPEGVTETGFSVGLTWSAVHR